MTKQEIKRAIKETLKELETACGCNYIRLSEELETLLYLYNRKK